MFKAGLDVTIHADIQTVWDAVTGYGDVSWRSDMVKAEVVEPDHVIAYSPKGVATHLYITEMRPCRLYEFKMKNKMYSGLWTGRFFELPDGQTLLRLLEEIHVRHFFRRLLWAMGDVAARRQLRFAIDLKAYVTRREI